MGPTSEQRVCIEETFGVSSAVVAGAGSGKTETLTNRVVFALEHPELSGVSDIGQILAITYTNKAAAELKSRIKAALERAATPENDLARQALKVDGAWISTIHGMCSRILKENAFTFGVDPAFSIVSEEVRAQLLDDAIEDVFNDAPANLDSHLSALFDEYRRSDIKDMLSDLVDEIAETGEDPREAFVLQPSVDPAECLLELIGFLQKVLARLDQEEQEKGKLTDAALRQRAQLDEGIREVYALGADQDAASASPGEERLAWLKALSAQEALTLADALPKLNGRLGVMKAPFDDVGLKPQRCVEGCILAIIAEIGRKHLETLLDAAGHVLNSFDARKRTLGYLDNGDLLALVAQALRDPRNASVAQRYAETFQLVMVDEFQDTNQMQVDMINLVAGGGGDAPSDKLCVVGDAQQSIYRFRNADLAVFQEHVGNVHVAPGGKVVPLSKNFRSHGEILAFVKGVFADVFDDGYLDLLHGRDEDRIQESAPFFGLGAHALPPADGNGDEQTCEDGEAAIPRRVNVKVFGAIGNAGISDRAAASIAADFKLLADRGNRPGQMAVLLGKMTHADAYAAALQDAGLKCAITGGTVFKDSAEATLVTDLCFALVNPHDTERLADVLTSDLFGLQPEDLVKLVSLREDRPGSLSDAFVLLAKNAFDSAWEAVLKDAPGLAGCSERLSFAMRVLVRAACRVGTRPLSAIVESVLVDSGWLSRLGDAGQERAGNAFKAIRMLRDVERESSAGPLRAARQLEARIMALKEAPGVLSAEGGDFVRIMTIHASKGLSIPIVAVAEAEAGSAQGGKLGSVTVGGKTYLSLKADRSLEGFEESSLLRKAASSFEDKGKTIASSVDAAMALQAASEATVTALDAARYYCAIKRLDALGDLEEHQRKLYVAYTRAKDALIVALRKTGKGGSKREGGAIDAPHAIAALLAGDAEAPEFTQASEAVRQLVELHTDYDDPAYTIDWKARLEVFPVQAEEGETGEDEADAAGPVIEPAAFAVPVGLPAPDIADVPYRAQWAEGVFSASSIKEAHGEAAAEEALDGSGDAGTVLPIEGLVFSEDDEPPAPATERGTAFHALCEWAAAHRAPGALLASPPQERIDAMARLFGLNARQQAELPALVERWIESPQARHAAQHAYVVPEQPFWVKLADGDPETGASPLVMQGFIDLLAYDEPGKGAAYVIDYKTGAFLDTDAKRRAAYELQAKCYAYALLLRGFESVELDFFFVDQPDDPATHFPASDQGPYTLESLREELVAQLRSTT